MCGPGGWITVPQAPDASRFREWYQYQGGILSSKRWDIGEMQLHSSVEDAICSTGAQWPLYADIPRAPVAVEYAAAAQEEA